MLRYDSFGLQVDAIWRSRCYTYPYNSISDSLLQQVHSIFGNKLTCLLFIYLNSSLRRRSIIITSLVFSLHRFRCRIEGRMSSPPRCRMSPRTSCPRARGHFALVPPQCRMSYKIRRVYKFQKMVVCSHFSVYTYIRSVEIRHWNNYQSFGWWRRECTTALPKGDNPTNKQCCFSLMFRLV